MSPPPHDTIAQALVEVCHRVAAKGFVTATDGNVSARLSSGNVLATPASLSKELMHVGDLVELDMEGAVVSGTRAPSSEMKMHFFIYRQRPDVFAIVHCHPVHATAFAVARIPLTPAVFPEVIVGLGDVPVAEYATPSTDDVGMSIAPYVNSSDAILLGNHGVVAYGIDLWDAFFKMEKVEYAAHILLHAKELGGARQLTGEEVRRLKETYHQGSVSRRSESSDR